MISRVFPIKKPYQNLSKLYYKKIVVKMILNWCRAFKYKYSQHIQVSSGICWKVQTINKPNTAVRCIPKKLPNNFSHTVSTVKRTAELNGLLSIFIFVTGFGFFLRCYANIFLNIYALEIALFPLKPYLRCTGTGLV